MQKNKIKRFGQLQSQRKEIAMILDYGTYWETGDPFYEIRQLQKDMNQNYQAQHKNKPTSHAPLINVWSGGDGLVARSELPGVSPEDIDLSVVGQNLTIRASVKPNEPKDGERFIRRERAHGNFFMTVKLPYRVAADKTEAKYRNGILTVTLKRPEEDKPFKINVKSK